MQMDRGGRLGGRGVALCGSLVLLVGVLGCGSDDEVTPQPQGGGGAGAGGAGGGGGVEEPPLPSEDWCERVVAGPGGERDFAVDWSAAHSSVRFFGTEISHMAVDSALIVALGGGDPWSFEALSTYGSTLAVACVLPANDSELEPAEVELVDGVAVVRPGTGSVELPGGANAAMIDLRGLPAVPELGAALDAAAEIVLDGEVARPSVLVRTFSGLDDEVYCPAYGVNSVYSHQVSGMSLNAIPGSASEALPVAVLTDAQLAPEAALFAATLRLAGRAWLVGEDVLSSVAEARWYGVGDGGVLHRDRVLIGAEPWPDVIAADLRSATPHEHARGLLDTGMPGAAPAGSMSRADMTTLSGDLEIQPDVHGIGDGRAALLVAHGATRLFFPYFDTVGDTIDTGLTENLGALATSTDSEQYFVLNALGRFSVHLHDSHGVTWYLGSRPSMFVGMLPVALDVTAQGEVVVRRSDLATILPGDELLSVGGEPVADAMARAEELIAASTPGALRRDALGQLTYIEADTTWELDEPGVGIKNVPVTVADAVTDYSLDVFQESSRTAGFLTDLGHPGIYYVNLDAEAYDGTPTAEELIVAAQGATGLIVDGRGYPGNSATWDFIEGLLETDTSVRFTRPVVNTLGTTPVSSSQTWAPRNGSLYAGPVAVLIGPTSQSQAEHILMCLVSTDRAQFVGRQTAGANGNITGVMTPGALGLLFTGMEVLFDDGSTFHGVGIVPDVEVYPTAADLAAGIDPELEAAIGVLGG